MPETIHTRRLLLRSYTLDDFPSFSRFMLDPEIGRYMSNNPVDMGEVTAMFARVQEIYEHPPRDRYFDIWAIEFEGHCIGHLELKHSENTAENELEIVYLIEKPFWNRGFMSELVAALVAYVRPTGKIIIATLDMANKASLRVLQRHGVSKSIDHRGDLKVWLMMTPPGPVVSE